MDQEEEKSRTSENNFNENKSKEIYQEIENKSVREKSLKNSRKDAQKPLYLDRYE
jgi:hypothetical protein